MGNKFKLNVKRVFIYSVSSPDGKLFERSRVVKSEFLTPAEKTSFKILSSGRVLEWTTVVERVTEESTSKLEECTRQTYPFSGA